MIGKDERALVIGINELIGDCVAKGLSDDGVFVYGIRGKPESCSNWNELVETIKTNRLEKAYYIFYNDKPDYEQFSKEEIEKVSQCTGIPFISIITIRNAINYNY